MNINPYHYTAFTVFRLIQCKQVIINQFNKGWLGDKDKGWFKYLYVEPISGDIMVCKPNEYIRQIILITPEFEKEEIEYIFSFKLCNN